MTLLNSLLQKDIRPNPKAINPIYLLLNSRQEQIWGEGEEGREDTAQYLLSVSKITSTIYKTFSGLRTSLCFLPHRR